jgi:cell division transport system permease protein
MRVEYYFRETAAGLRRNGVVTFAAMSTAFIALFLFGLALLINREFQLVIDAWTGNVEVAVYMADPVQGETIAHVEETLRRVDGVSIEYWDKQETCDHFDRLFEGQQVFTENVDCEQTIPTSLRVSLEEASQYDQVTAALGCEFQDQGNQTAQVCAEPGVLKVADYRKVLERLLVITNVLSIGVASIAVIMLASAVALVANTLRMGMFARRKEIGIMRLVGASNWRVRVPFLIEGLVEALVGAAFAIISLFAIKVFAIDRLRGEIPSVPLLRNSDVLATAPWILIAATVVAIVAGTIGMRRFLDV